MQYRQTPNIVLRSAAESHLLIPVEGDMESVYTLNRIGCRLWELLAEPMSEKDLADAICRHFDIPRETALRDVADFLAEMRKMNLVVPAQ